MPQKETTIFSDQNTSGKGSRLVWLLSVLAIAFLAALAAAVYFYLQNQSLRKNPQQVAQAEVKSIVAKVSHLILLPQGETPTIATVTDPKLLKDQPFFSKAQKGDQVLIYTNAKMAILYNPTTNLIIAVAPLTIGSTATASPSPVPSPSSTK